MIEVMNGVTGAIDGKPVTPEPPAMPEPNPEDKE